MSQQLRNGAAAMLLVLAISTAQANSQGSPDDFFDLPLEDLLSIEVSSVSRKTEALGDTAAATYVVTGDAIRQRGITTIPEALRGVPGVHVGRINASQWAVSIRGFAGRYTNKLLVLVDGRSVYLPSFSGVYWDQLDTLLDDIDRIEVIRGPGGTLWGPNAVNGVINIITRNAEETQGTLMVAGTGNRDRAGGSLRYGGRLGEETFGRVYAKHGEYEGFQNTLDGADSGEEWQNSQVGFRVDNKPNQRDTLTVQGDAYNTDGEQQVGLLGFGLTLSDFEAEGRNILGRWTRTFDSGSNFSLQAYYDYSERRESFINQRHTTADLDFQHRIPFSDKHDFLWGLSYRNVSDDISGGQFLSLNPPQRKVSHYGAFVQSEFTLTGTTRVIVGTKVDDNAFTGVEVQPNVRAIWQPNDQHTIWTSVARAVRTPSRGELNGVVPLGPGTRLDGNPDIASENLVAFELGYRFASSNGMLLDLAAYHNDYRQLITSQIVLPPVSPEQLNLIFDNNLKGTATGLEASLSWQLMPHWRLSANYSFIDQEVEPSTPEVAPLVSNALQFNSAPHQISIDNDVNLSDNWFLNVRTQYVDEVPSAASQVSFDTDSYIGLDASLSWRRGENLEVLLTGRNLLGKRLEFLGETDTPASDIGRMAYVQLRMRWR